MLVIMKGRERAPFEACGVMILGSEGLRAIGRLVVNRSWARLLKPILPLPVGASSVRRVQHLLALR